VLHRYFNFEEIDRIFEMKTKTVNHDGITEVMQELGRGAITDLNQKVEVVKKRALDAHKKTRAVVQENPFASIGAALGAGLLLGAFIFRRR
jgi:ElaB/YqjD/DUF883 family membrane-anchored ribosome-binding protein